MRYSVLGRRTSSGLISVTLGLATGLLPAAAVAQIIPGDADRTILTLGLAPLTQASAPRQLSLCDSKATQADSNGTARFVLSSEEGRQVVEYEVGVNLVFCRRTTATMVWLRFAESSDNDGEESPHLDIDLGNATTSGRPRPMVARAQPCPGGATWALWWHDGSGGVFANGPDSASCDMNLEVTEDGLRGRFSCRRLVDDEGRETLHVLEGSFECNGRTSPHIDRPPVASIASYGTP